MANAKTKRGPDSARVDIISIGTLSRNLWRNEPQAVRTPHATTTLIRVGSRHILVDPGLPAAVLNARIFERAGLRPEQIDTVFLTNFRPAHRGGLALFSSARVFMHEPEQQWMRQKIQSVLEDGELEDEQRRYLDNDLALLEQISTPDDKLADNVDLFPLPGYTPGNCGLLVSAVLTTTLIAGDAIATFDHFLAGQILPDSANVETAQESFREVYEIADVVVPGHDNIFVNPRMQGM